MVAIAGRLVESVAHRAVFSVMAMTEREKYLKYHSSRLAKKRRAERNTARRRAEKKHGKSALKGKDVDHIRTNPGGELSNSPSNLRIVNRKKNRSRTANLWRKIKERNH